MLEGHDGDDDAIYEVRYDGDDEIYELEKLSEDLRGSQLKFIDFMVNTYFGMPGIMTHFNIHSGLDHTPLDIIVIFPCSRYHLRCIGTFSIFLHNFYYKKVIFVISCEDDFKSWV